MLKSAMKKKSKKRRDPMWGWSKKLKWEVLKPYVGQFPQKPKTES